MAITLIPGSKRSTSPSSLNTWFRCPRLYYYKYIQRLKEESKIHLVKGSVIHTVLELFFSRYERDLKKRMDTLLKENWKLPKDLKVTEKEEQDAIADCKKILDVFRSILEIKYDAMISGEKAENVRHAFYLTRPKFSERRIVNKLYNLIGIIDVVDKDFDGNTIVVDYKTGSLYSSMMSEEIIRQLSFYVLLQYLEDNKYPQIVVGNYVRYGVQQMLQVTPSLVSNIIMDINHFITYTQSDDIEDYPMKEGNLCNHPKYQCPFFDFCSGVKCLNSDRQKTLADIFKPEKKELKVIDEKTPIELDESEDNDSN